MRRWLLYIVFLLGTYVAPHAAFAAPATIDTSSSAQATANSAQRKTFFDSTNNRHWAFYYNGTAIEYSYSSGIFNLTESEIVSKSLRTFGQRKKEDEKTGNGNTNY